MWAQTIYIDCLSACMSLTEPDPAAAGERLAVDLHF